jgi:hypothetical protein
VTVHESSRGSGHEYERAHAALHRDQRKHAGGENDESDPRKATNRRVRQPDAKSRNQCGHKEDGALERAVCSPVELDGHQGKPENHAGDTYPTANG